MGLTLLVLAAGMGSRYGGLKQLDAVGPSGETVLDYAVFDAMRTGFTRVVFVIRREFETVFRERIGAKYSGKIGVDYVFQSIDTLPGGFRAPAGREKPWGTGHAVWCARDLLRENFAVINADDFYGIDSFAQLGGFLTAARATQFAMVGFKLANTLSEHGAVSRGVCTIDGDAMLRGVVEQTGITPAEVGTGKKYSGGEIVSMNCWGFTPALFSGIDTQLRAFLEVTGPQPGTKAEFYLPAAVSTLVEQGKATVRVLPTASQWFGVTYREDKPRVEAALAALIAAGQYPTRLFTS
ncbi:MAG TPA: sugar phosphate nucleotidyltransferase [Opitutaceae bacterium]|nr:sugar phosphate nucleotidyltransferase [Opitutaceae bacterium]